MSKLQELIKKLCPDGVEFRKLGEVCIDITTGKLNANAMDKNGKYPFFTCDAQPYWINEYAFDKEAILISGNGSQVGHINYYNGRFNAYQRTYILSGFISSINAFFLFYYLKCYFRQYIILSCRNGSVPYITLPVLYNFEIPLPPLEVQNEIVRILDTFTSHTAELQAELQARKEQYEYYRNKLLTFDENDERVKWIKLGEIGNTCMCKRIMKHQTSDIGEVPFFKIGTFGKEADAFISYELYDEYKNKYSFPRKGEILISASGTIGRTVIYDGQDAYFQDSNIIWIQNDESKVLNKYLYYYYQIIEWNVEGGTIKRLYNTNLSKTIIAYPPLSEQQRIISILDKFESLVNDLSEGLPAEIAAVQEQYEYYRNKLLTFKRKS